MRAQRYGAPVVARRVGGLGDTIIDNDTGFLFDAYEPPAFDEAVDRAMAAFASPDELRRMRWVSMERDFSWDGVAEQYRDAYASALHRVIGK
jgi:starch synthase